MSNIARIDRTMNGVREALFDAIDGLRAGRIDAKDAKTMATIALALIKSVDVQLNFEKLVLESKVPKRLPSMPLMPLIPEKTGD